MAEEEKDIEELKHIVFHNAQMEKERAISDSKYAIKMVEQIVFGMVTVILLAVLGALVALVVR